VTSRRVCSWLLSIFTLLVVSCGPTDKSGKKYFVAFSQCNSAEPYRAAQNQRMQELFGKKSDVQLVVADAQQDNSKQIAQIEAFIRQRPDLLIVAPNERAPLAEVMGRAMAAHIPVICLERDITEPNYTTFVGADNLAIGKMAGEFMLSELQRRNSAPRGTIVEIRGLLGVEAEMERYNGAHEALKPYPQIRFVHEAVADWLQSNGRDRMVEILRADPQIDIVYGHNDPMAVGAYLAARELQRENQMEFIGVDGLGGPSGGIKKVMDGILTATFHYPLCVDKAVEVGDKMLRDPNFHPEKRYILQAQLITKANAAEIYQKDAN
jgi:ribose transport system substrate-binding protein